jgi:hypothetical protein
MAIKRTLGRANALRVNRQRRQRRQSIVFISKVFIEIG